MFQNLFNGIFYDQFGPHLLPSCLSQKFKTTVKPQLIPKCSSIGSVWDTFICTFSSLECA